MRGTQKKKQNLISRQPLSGPAKNPSLATVFFTVQVSLHLTMAAQGAHPFRQILQKQMVQFRVPALVKRAVSLGTRTPENALSAPARRSCSLRQLQL